MSAAVCADLLSVAEVSAILPGNPSNSTIGRWIRLGFRGHKLAARRVGGRLWVPRESLDRFLAETQECAE